MTYKYCLIIVAGVLTSLSVKAKVMLAPREVRVCPGSEAVVVFTCNETRNILRWNIEAPPMFSSNQIVTSSDPIGIPVPFAGQSAINVTVHGVSSSGVSSSVSVDISNYDLTKSMITITCGSTVDRPSASIRYWGKCILSRLYYTNHTLQFPRSSCYTKSILCQCD